MGVFLAVLAFLAGQICLLHVLNRLDRFLEGQTNPSPERETLTIVFADPSAANFLAEPLERFSRSHPEIGIRLCSCQDVPEAVYAGKAAVGFLRAGPLEYPELKHVPLTVKTAPVVLANCGLKVIPLEAESEQEMVWKKHGASACAALFVGYMRSRGAAGSGIFS